MATEQTQSLHLACLLTVCGCLAGLQQVTRTASSGLSNSGSPKPACAVLTKHLLLGACRIPFINDIIPQVPCTPTMAACKNTVVPNPNPTGTWPYSSVGGTLQLLPSGMPNQAAQWAGFGKIYPCQLVRFLMATHICRCVLTRCP
eukprot:GHRQ01026089.1.p1 GENE.GHRQ01026089.1~~GHRQ01026089.1.p1  ORF type:complete len:145 (-),score=33.04 GHRQ01026089.1:1123-1557(-)